MPAATHGLVDAPGSEATTAAAHPDDSRGTRSRTVLPDWWGWVAVAVITAAVAATWVPDMRLPFGDSHEGRILARFGLHVRNFWDVGLFDSSFATDLRPYSSSYAHHPPLTNAAMVAVSSVLGEGEWQLRVYIYGLGLSVIPLSAGLLRSLGLRWIPVLGAIGLMVATNFYWVYGRFGTFALMLALAWAITHLRALDEVPSWKVVGVAALAAVTIAMSWLGMATAAGLGLWLFQRRRIDRVTLTLGVTMALTAIAVFAWVLAGSGSGNLADQLEFRTTGGGFTTEEFLNRQWRFTRELLPSWYLAIFPVAVVAGLVDARTRFLTAIFFVVALGWGVGLPNGSFIHDYWNVTFLVPGVIGMAALFDWLARSSDDRAMTIATSATAGALIVLAFAQVVRGPAHDIYFEEPAQAGFLAREFAPEVDDQNRAWMTAGLAAPRWLSYYWDLQPRGVSADNIADVPPDDYVIMHTKRIPAWAPDGLEDYFLARRGVYGVLKAEALQRSATAPDA